MSTHITRDTRLALMAGAVGCTIFLIVFGYIYAGWKSDSPRDELLIAAFISTPTSALICQLVSICRSGAPEYFQWGVFLVAGIVQWFTLPAVICWLLFDPSRPIDRGERNFEE